ncbi:ParB N-terminal domain-containing protein [Qipengyuania sp. 6B39]|uniref:ParB N-terminal domain-containing protein n=1 Tax=Qipengyuania proteolytica TaxID=2867239 RepID=UPI001C8975DB|nr:ParB N-terminal domain-containing protein [Qipengyuania proteolytica]MBX7496986.1 ParB N-terminal domain-containing protein [Qipengyuania proteolytica]
MHPPPPSFHADRTLEVVYKTPGDLDPDPRNARTHSRKQIAQIEQSIRAFGFTNPVLADPDGNLIAGHGRLRAAKKMGLDKVPVITLDGLTEPQKKALRLADNKIALNAGWDTEILKLELAELSLPEIDIDLGLTGFSPGEIDVVLSEVEETELSAFKELKDRVRISVAGEPDLTSSGSQGLALVFHELITNAIKYGALSNVTGHVEVRIREVGNSAIIVWTEHNGPAVDPERNKGFGSTLIARALDSHGSANLDFARDGVACRIELDLI